MLLVTSSSKISLSHGDYTIYRDKNYTNSLAETWAFTYHYWFIIREIIRIFWKKFVSTFSSNSLSTSFPFSLNSELLTAPLFIHTSTRACPYVPPFRTVWTLHFIGALALAFSSLALRSRPWWRSLLARAPSIYSW